MDLHCEERLKDFRECKHYSATVESVLNRLRLLRLSASEENIDALMVICRRMLTAITEEKEQAIYWIEQWDEKFLEQDVYLLRRCEVDLLKAYSREEVCEKYALRVGKTLLKLYNYWSRVKGIDDGVVWRIRYSAQSNKY